MNSTALTWGLLGLLGALGFGASPRVDDPTTTTRVRAQSPDLARLIQDGIDRSVTFRRLVQHIDETDGIVYIESGACSTSGAAGCLLLGVTEVGPVRYLHIHVTRQTASQEQRIPIVGHELQHAYEILSRRSVRSTADAYALFIRIGSAGSIRSLETDEAQRTESAIARELAACRTRRIRENTRHWGGEEIPHPLR